MRDESGPVSTEMKIAWMVGFTLSIAGLIFQMMLYLLVPSSRKMDQKLLTQLSVARLLNVVLEYLVKTMFTKTSLVRDALLTLYVQTDAALICWMFVFSKNLYDKVINVSDMKSSFIFVSVIIWTAMIPIGILCPTLMYLDAIYFISFHQIYSVVKFLVLTVNLCFICSIFKVAFTKPDRKASILKTCVVSSILLSISCAQAQGDIFVSNLLARYCFTEQRPQIAFAFGAINSYQVMVITLMFVILVNSACEQPLKQVIVKKFVKQRI